MLSPFFEPYCAVGGHSSPTLISMKHRSVALLFGILQAGCGGHPWYESADAFHKGIDTRSLAKRPIAEAIASLETEGFTCLAKPGTKRAFECSRRVEKFPCVQHQMLGLEPEGGASRVTGYVGSDVKLPSACL